MKRKGYIIEKIADMDNLRAADRAAQLGKNNRSIRRHNLNADENLQKLQKMILTLDFPDPKYMHMMVVSDAGKTRNIVKQHYFPWRILHHAIMQVIDIDFMKVFITDTSACIKGRGIHYGVRRMKMFMRRYPKYKWFVKTDFKKFYESIPHDVIIAALRRKYKDERFIKLIEITILSYQSSNLITETLNEERKKRNANRLLYESTVRQLHLKCD